MTRVQAIEEEIKNLSPSEFAELLNWLREQDWAEWDRELEQDVAGGRLDALAAEALAEFERGETTEL